MSDTRPVIVWFRNDLRLADHEALYAAAKSGAPLLPLFILDDETLDDDTKNVRPIGGASRWWLHQSLRGLRAAFAEYGGTLILRKGRTLEILADVLDETEACALHAIESFEPFGAKCEVELAALCARRGVPLRLHPGRLLFAPKDIATKEGKPYRVFTPFWRACLSRPRPKAPLGVPSMASFAKAKSLSPGDLDLEPTKPDWAGGLRDFWQPGERAAQDRLTFFLDQLASTYAKSRDNLFGDPTSRLSPHLHFGEISPRQVWHRALHASQVEGGAAQHGIETFLKELGWREFSYHLLRQFPDMPNTPLRPEFSRFPWRTDRAALLAWQRGQTGYPVVDAGMRQLWQTGWMPNRVRMIAASFLVKHLLLPWQDGEAWFWDTLADADIASNSASWQWVAGCGADAAPYFRIFNPILQGQKFDPEGEYVRRWVPELAHVPAHDIHAPWQASKGSAPQASLDLGEVLAPYPAPLVEHGAARARALAALDTLKS